VGPLLSVTSIAVCSRGGCPPPYSTRSSFCVFLYSPVADQQWNDLYEFVWLNSSPTPPEPVALFVQWFENSATDRAIATIATTRQQSGLIAVAFHHDDNPSPCCAGLSPWRFCGSANADLCKLSKRAQQASRATASARVSQSNGRTNCLYNNLFQ
jgi:hypothetical protein